MGIQVLVICLVGLALYLIGRLVWSGRSALPPGPPGWPLIGNLLDFPIRAPYKTLGAMNGKYGPIISVNVMGTQYVVLNSFKVTKDLLENRGAITSNRPHFTMCGDLIATKKSLEVFFPTKEAEASQFLRNVLKSPDDLTVHSRRAAGSVILKISHGYSVKEDGDPLVEVANKAMDHLSMIATPGRFLVDMLPIFRYLPEWFPGGGFHKDAKQWRKILNEAVDTPYEFVLERLAKGDAAPSFISRVLQEGVTPEDEEVLKWASFSMYLGGSDTTPSTLSAFFLAMTIYPEILKEAQAEVDAVIGHERLPTFEDRDALPYVNAICTEMLRWHVVVPLAMHVTTQDNIYEGYLIPKGTCLLANIWFILSNPETYPDPDVFKPERFLGKDQQPDPREACFGYGRRSCPGAQLAELSIFIYIVMALTTLDVSRCVMNGAEWVPRYDAKEGAVRHVEPFKCRIVPRSKKAEDLLRA